MRSLIDLNLHLLGQALELVRTQARECYAQACGDVFFSSIGQHLRHCIEHYEEFLCALQEGRSVDYENRPRDAQVETCSSRAEERIEGIVGALNSLGEQNARLCVTDAGTTNPTESSTDRELLFLVSHTVHHFALISVISSLWGQPVPQHFGIAPSTLTYRGVA